MLTKTRPMGMRLPPQQEQEIKRLVGAGLYLSKGEFVREAIRERLQSVELMELREVSHEQARKEIEAYIAARGTAWTSEIAHDLRLDLDLVLAILKELRHEGRVRPDDGT